MPSGKPRLEDNEIHDIVMYLRSLRGKFGVETQWVSQ